MFTAKHIGLLTVGAMSLTALAAVDESAFPSNAVRPFVDRYGQFAHDDWPGKVHGDEEMASVREAEEEWLKDHSCPIPDADEYGGWSGGPQLKATGFFRTEKVDGKWWLVDPKGRLFFSHGVDCVSVEAVTGVGFREDCFSWIPTKDDKQFGKFVGESNWPGIRGFYSDKSRLPYATFDFAKANAKRKYGSDWYRLCAVRTHDRIRAWGLNTIGNWSDHGIYGLRKTPYTVQISTAGTPRLEGSSGWWGALPDPFNPEFEATLRKRAKDLAKTMRDDPWCIGVFVDNELSWTDESHMKDVAEGYFSTVRRVLREELPNHLYLGCRIGWGGDSVYVACARHCDVVSINYYGRTPKDWLPPGAQDKPMLIGEFHFGALDRGLFRAGLVVSRDQKERAKSYRAFVNACLDQPRFVGVHWFQWRDQPLTGRPLDGENYQIGFVTVTDAPYPELVDAAREIGATMYARRSSSAVQIGGVFPLLCTPYSEDGSLDCATLAKEAVFVADCGADGMIWPAANDAMKFLSPEEERRGLESVAAALDGRDVWFSPCCPGTNTTDMLRRVAAANEISAKHPGLKTAMLVRMVDDAKCDGDYARQYDALAAATKLPVIIQTYNGKSPMPSAKALIDLARRHPDTYGWYKVEGTGGGIVPCARELAAAKPVVKTVFTGWGGRDWLYHYRRVGTRGAISQRPMYADLMVKTWKALESGDPAADELFAKFMYLRNLDNVLPAPEMRGWNLYVLKKRGVFRNTLSRTKKRADGRWEVADVALSEEDKSEIDARLTYAIGDISIQGK